MQRRALIWALALPFVAASVLVGHRLAYAATGVDPGPMHGYLAHAPQVVLVLALVALLAAAAEQRVSPRFDALPYVAPAVFVAQEHLERYVHTGSVPFLLSDRTFVLGLALQAPLALVVARLSRKVVRVLACVSRGRAAPPRLWALPAPSHAHVPAVIRSCVELRHRPVRGPPRAC